MNNFGKLSNLKERKFCCFCGGTEKATTIDHVPPIGMFTDRRRPKGLEFPACYNCNNLMRRCDAVIAVISRICPDGDVEKCKNKLKKIFQTAEHLNPGILEEFRTDQTMIVDYVNHPNMTLSERSRLMRLDGPIVASALKLFGAKLGMAMYYHHSNKILSRAGGIFVQHYTNLDLINEKLPDVIEYMHGPISLIQGKWSAESQFRYGLRPIDTYDDIIFYFTFRLSFAILAWVKSDRSGFPDPNHPCVLVPGCFLNLSQSGK